jgi:hypothetical protein
MYEFIIPNDTEFEKYMNLQLKNWKDKTRMEVEDLKLVLSDLNPKYIVDWGCGLGRASISFYHEFSWNQSKFLLCDKTGIERFIENREWIDEDGNQLNPMGSFNHNKSIPYNDLNLTKMFCEMNGLRADYLDIDEVTDLGSPDLLFSMHCVGYHFSINSFLRNVRSSPNIMLFGVRKKDNICEDIQKYDGYTKEKYKGSGLQDYVVFRKDANE